MADSNGWKFERGLDNDFMQKLQCEANKRGWFADVLGDRDLVLGIRKNYLNVYWRGQSLFKVTRAAGRGPLMFSTHPKYLVDPNLYKAVKFDGSRFETGGLEPLIRKYDGSSTLKRMKRAAQIYCGEEKQGLQEVIRGNENVIDTEIAFSREADGEKAAYAPRIDLACVHNGGASLRLRFWEAKLYSNPEIRAAGDALPPVVEQVKGYRELIHKHRDEIVESYSRVARNLRDIAGWSGSARKVGGLVAQLAGDQQFSVDPVVGLIIYGYGDAQKRNDRWRREIKKLEGEAGIPIRRAGNAKSIELRCDSE